MMVWPSRVAAASMLGPLPLVNPVFSPMAPV